DGGNRHFVLVQLPEPLPKPERSLKTIADIARERVRRVGDRLREEDTGRLGLNEATIMDSGFRVFKLAESSFKVWQSVGPRDSKDLAQQLEIHINHIREGRT